MKTKNDYIDLLFNLLEPLKSKFSPSASFINLSGAGATYSRDVVCFEAFARPLWGLVPYWKTRGEDDFFAPIYRKGIIEGTNPESNGYWGDCTDFDQRYVEMAPFAFALIAIPEILWDPLTKEQQERFASWLGSINDHQFSKCNWLYFRVLVNMALKARGLEFRQDRLDEDLAAIESWYDNKGWYVDGVSGRTDYYCAFAMMYYPLLLQGLGYGNPAILDKAKLFAEDFKYWFAENGAALPYGRSLTYRFAQASFWAAATFAGADIDLALAKGIISRNLDFWMSQDIFNGDGTLSVGYAYPDLAFAENYNAPGSPYWSFKIFLFLALDDNHPFWSVEEKPLTDLDPIKRMDSANMIVQNSGWNATCYTIGNTKKKDLGHFVEKYFKFAYSTEFPMCISHSQYNLEDLAPDSTISFMLEDGLMAVRRNSFNNEIGENYIKTDSVVASGIRVSSKIIVGENYHIRQHKISVERDCIVYDSGFAIPKDKNTTISDDGKTLTILNNNKGCSITMTKGKGETLLINPVPNTSIMYRNVYIPAITFSMKKGETVEIETRIDLIH